MKRTAFSLWNERIAPVFDVAKTIWIVETAEGRVVGQTGRRFSSDDPHERALRLATLQVEQLVCGAITRSTQEALKERGIEVVSFVAGDLKQVMQAWLADHLHDRRLKMPGCRRGIRRGAGRGSGRRSAAAPEPGEQQMRQELVAVAAPASTCDSTGAAGTESLEA